MKGCKMTTKKDEKQDGQSIDELFNTAQPKVKVDPTQVSSNRYSRTTK